MTTSETTRFNFPDDDLRERVCNFLGSRHFPAFKDLHVDVENGSVLISGEVSSYYEKQVALTVCSRVAGVLSLVDKITVRQEERNPVASESLGN